MNGCNALTPELLHKMDACRRAANSLSVGQIHLYNNPILKGSLTLLAVKSMLPGHWGTTPGLSFIHGSTLIAGNLSDPSARGRNRTL